MRLRGRRGGLHTLAAVPAGVLLTDVDASYSHGAFGGLFAVFGFEGVFKGAGAEDQLVVWTHRPLMVADELDQTDPSLWDAELVR